LKKAKIGWEVCGLKKILIVEDDLHIGNMLEETLTNEGYAVLRAYSGTEAVLLLSKTKPDLILLDLMLPGLSGEEVLPQIKGIPVIVVSAKMDMPNKVDLLLGGASDYITKPFDMKELLARITVQFRHTSLAHQKARLTFDNIVLDTGTRSVTVLNREVKLTRTEYAILKLLMQNPNQVITKSQILDNINEDTPDCTENSLKTHLSHLRGKLREAGGRDYIEAVWGIGFKMKEN
jgi:DNA-binding response OmpR family regulator